MGPVLKVLLAVFIWLLLLAGLDQSLHQPDPCAPGFMLQRERC